MKIRVVTLAAAAAVVFGLTAPASAQSPTTNRPSFELGAGYQFLYAGEICDVDDEDACSETQTFPFGLAVDGLWSLGNGGPIGIVGEFGWSRDSNTFTIPLVPPQEVTDTFNLFHFAGGVRWTGRSSPTFWPYAQVVAGPIINVFSSDDDLTDSDTLTRFMLQPGVGATFVAGDGWGIFGQVDYRRIFLDEEEDFATGRNDFRVFVGVRMILD